MATRSDTVWLLIPRQLRELPADLAAVTLGVVLTLGSVFLPVISDTPLRVAFGLVFVLFLPGYAFIAALFPEAGESPTTTNSTEHSKPDEEGDNGRPTPEPGTTAATTTSTTSADPSFQNRGGVDGIERVALSFGLSIAIVPLIGLILNFTPWGIRLGPVAVSVSGFTLVSVAVAAQRRNELSPDKRLQVPYREWLATVRTELVEPETRTDAALNMMLVVSLLLAVSSVGYAVAVPPQGEQFSEFYLLTEQSDGELVADDYPQEIAVTDRPELIVGIGNQEYEQTNYTVIVQLQEVTIEGNTTTVEERREIDRFAVSVAHNETHHERHTLVPTRTGENLRVQYLLYTGEVPETLTAETAYRELHLWMNITSTEQPALNNGARVSGQNSNDHMSG